MKIRAVRNAGLSALFTVVDCMLHTLRLWLGLPMHMWRSATAAYHLTTCANCREALREELKRK